MATTWNDLAKKVFSKEDKERIVEFAQRAETNSDNCTREVLMTAWQYTKFGEGENAYEDNIEDWILDGSLETLISVYKDVEFQKVMDKLNYYID